MQGYIKLHRKMVNWEWYTDINTKTLFIHCLIMANHKPTKWRGYDVGVGEFVTSLSKLSSQTGLSIQQIRTSLSKLKSTQDITQYQHSKFTMIKVLNYAVHQGKEDNEINASNTISTQNATTNQQQSNTQVNTKVTTNKNDKKLKNDKNDKKKENNKKKFTPPTLKEIEGYCIERNNNVNAKDFYDYFTAGNWVDSKGNKVKSWKQKVITWENLGNNKKNIKGTQSKGIDRYKVLMEDDW